MPIAENSISFHLSNSWLNYAFRYLSDPDQRMELIERKNSQSTVNAVSAHTIHIKLKDMNVIEYYLYSVGEKINWRGTNLSTKSIHTIDVNEHSHIPFHQPLAPLFTYSNIKYLKFSSIQLLNICSIAFNVVRTLDYETFFEIKETVFYKICFMQNLKRNSSLFQFWKPYWVSYRIFFQYVNNLLIICSLSSFQTAERKLMTIANNRR